MIDENLKEIIKSHVKAMKVISDDTYQLSLSLKSKDPKKSEEHIKSDLIVAAFYITAARLATESFNEMVNEVNEDPKNNKGQLHYFKKAIARMEAENAAKSEAIKEAMNEDK